MKTWRRRSWSRSRRSSRSSTLNILRSDTIQNICFSLTCNVFVVGNYSLWKHNYTKFANYNMCQKWGEVRWCRPNLLTDKKCGVWRWPTTGGGMAHFSPLWKSDNVSKKFICLFFLVKHVVNLEIIRSVHWKNIEPSLSIILPPLFSFGQLWLWQPSLWNSAWRRQLFVLHFGRNGCFQNMAKFIVISSLRAARAFNEYHTRPSWFNWGPTNVHFGKLRLSDLNINARIFLTNYKNLDQYKAQFFFCVLLFSLWCT